MNQVPVLYQQNAILAILLSFTIFANTACLTYAGATCAVGGGYCKNEPVMQAATLIVMVAADIYLAEAMFRSPATSIHTLGQVYLTGIVVVGIIGLTLILGTALKKLEDRRRRR